MRRRDIRPIRVVRSDGTVDAGALQRQLDAMTDLLQSLVDGPVGGLSTVPVDIVHVTTTPDDRADPIDARVGSLAFHIPAVTDGGPSSTDCAVYVKVNTDPTGSHWKRAQTT